MNSSIQAPSPAPILSAENPPPRVLVVDDQPDSLRLLQIRLQVAGMECIALADGQAALDYLAAQPVDVVILDVMMPGMDGLTICRRLKTDARTRDIPVLFLTGNTETVDKVLGLEAGAHDYLGKPVDQQELLARTRAALRVKRLQDQLKGQLDLQRRLNELHQGMLHEHWEKTFGQLAASLAHEINNPLAAALGGVQLLTFDAAPDEATHEQLVTIEHGLLEAAEKLRSLLLIAQTDSHPRPVSLADLVNDLVTLANYQALHCHVNLVTDLDPACRWFGSIGDLARATLYLLNNAVEASAGRNQATVTVAVRREPDHCRLSVADEGPGIAASIKARIFEPFFTTKAPPHHGVGLGLARSIVHSLGGQITFESPASAAATEFTIRLPVATPEESLGLGQGA